MISPALIFSKKSIISINVLLPEPDSPISARFTPSNLIDKFLINDLLDLE